MTGHRDLTGREIKIGDIVYFQAVNNGKRAYDASYGGCCGYATSTRFNAFGEVVRVSATGKSVYAKFVWVTETFRKGYTDEDDQKITPQNVLIVDYSTVSSLDGSYI